MHPSLSSRVAHLFILLSVAFSPLAAIAQRLPQGSACSVVTGNPYRSPDATTVFVITPDCKKRPIFNPDVYFSHFENWGRVIFLERNEVDAIPEHELKFLPWGPRRTFLNGSLIKTTDDPRVYLLQDGKIHPIENEAAFKDLGYAFNQIEDVDPAVLAKFTRQAETIKGSQNVPATVVFKYAGDPKVYVLKQENGQLVKEHLTSMEAVKQLVRPDRIIILSPVRTFPDKPSPTPTQTPPTQPTAPTSTSMADTAVPTVSFTLPSNATTVNGTITVTANASDNAGISSVQFRIGSTVIATDTSSPYSTALDTSAYANGAYTLTAVATDTSGNAATATRGITISNAAPAPVTPTSTTPTADTTAPVVSITSPSNGATVSGTITFSANASDAVGVTSVAFRINSTTLATDASSPYSTSLNTSGYANGSHTLSAIATDAAGNQSTATRSITISNVVETPGGTAQCNDGVDNDGDGLIDYQYDQGCYGSADATEGGLSNGSRDNGWSVFEPSADTRIIYVSDSQGNNSNNGLSPNTPVKTVSAALNLVRSGFPDWVLFKRGDTFVEFDQMKKSGRSSAEPLLFSAYGSGTQRPRFVNSGVNTSGAGNGPTSTNYLVLKGLEFSHDRREPGNANFDAASNGSTINWLRGAQDLLFEDCIFRWAGVALQTYDGFPIENVTFYRCQFLDSYTTSGHQQNMYLSGPGNLLIDESLFDHGGWNASVPGGDSTIFNHNIYIQNGTPNITIRNSISMRASSHGIQARAGGVVENSFFYRNPINILVGGGNTPDPGGVVGQVIDNVVVEGVNMNTGEGRGWGIDFSNINSVNVSGNIVKDCLGTHCQNMPAGVSGVTYGANVIHNWGGQSAQTSGNYPNPNATLAGYAATLGLSLDQFLAELRNQSPSNWRAEFTTNAINNYFRSAFGLPLR